MLADLSVSSAAFAYGEWLDPQELRSIIAAAGVTVGRWAECRLTDSGPAAPREPANLHLGADIFAAPGATVHSPLPGTLVLLSGSEVVLDLGCPAGRALFLRLAGISPASGLRTGAHIAAGSAVGVISAQPAPHKDVLSEPVAAVPAPPRAAARERLEPPETAAPARIAATPAAEASAAVAPAAVAPAGMAEMPAAVVQARTGLPPHVHVQLLAAADLPSHGTPGLREAWLAVCPDPSPLLGVPVAAQPPAPAPQLLRARAAVVAKPQHLYYSEPAEIVRGWRHHLYDANGRGYVDMINNIASVGHSHPRIAAAAWRQLRTLNTNSRFLYGSMTRYCARIAELLPPELGRVFLVNSGSEAADLALQLARAWTGRRDVIALAGAYHGWTGSVLDVCTSPMDRPNWRDELQPYIHVADQPDPYRGRFGADGPRYAESVRTACAAAAARGAGTGVAAFIAEPLLGNQGGVEPTAGFFPAAYQAVREAGGLCIADEVQVGLGRTGETFWSFEYERAVPDILITAKAAGNGHPLGVVACRPDVAAAFDGRSAYFSSTGGRAGFLRDRDRRPRCDRG